MPPTSPLKRLYVIETLGPAGAEYLLLYLLLAMVERGHHCEVAVLHAPYDLAPRFEAAGIRVHRLDIKHRFDAATAVLKLGRLLRRGRFDLACSDMYFASMYLAMSRAIAPAPRRIATFHHVDYDIYPADRVTRRIQKATYGWLMRNAIDAHVGVSRAVAEHYRRHLRLPRIQVIPNGFPIPAATFDAAAVRATRARFGASCTDFLLVCPARFALEKGHRYLVEAMALLRDEGVPVRCLLFGAGPLENDVRAQVSRLGLEGVVTLHTPVPQQTLLDVMKASDALILPSPRGEGFGRVLAEAMALERAVITPAVGGALDFIDDDRTGLLVEPESAVALAAAVRRLVVDPGLRLRIGAAARHVIVNRFEIHIVAAHWEDFYGKIPAGSSGRGHMQR